MFYSVIQALSWSYASSHLFQLLSVDRLLVAYFTYQVLFRNLPWFSILRPTIYNPCLNFRFVSLFIYLRRKGFPLVGVETRYFSISSVLNSIHSNSSVFQTFLQILTSFDGQSDLTNLPLCGHVPSLCGLIFKRQLCLALPTNSCLRLARARPAALYVRTIKKNRRTNERNIRSNE